MWLASFTSQSLPRNNNDDFNDDDIADDDYNNFQQSLIKEYGHRRLHELGARRKKNLNPESGVVSQLVGNIVAFKKPMQGTDYPLARNDGNKKESETANQQFPIPKSAQLESPSSLDEFPTKSETRNVHRQTSTVETSQQNQQQSSCKNGSRKSSHSRSKGGKEEEEEEEVTDKSEKDDETRPLTKTTTTDTLISNSSSMVACFMSEPAGLNCEISQLQLDNLHLLNQKLPSVRPSSEQNGNEFLDSFPDVSRKRRKSMFGIQLSIQSEDIRRTEVESENIPKRTEQPLRKLSSMEVMKSSDLPLDPTCVASSSAVVVGGRVGGDDDLLFPVDELSSTIAASMRTFFESRLETLKTRIALLEADNLAKSQQIQVLNSMLEQKMKATDANQSS